MLRSSIHRYHSWSSFIFVQQMPLSWKITVLYSICSLFICDQARLFRLPIPPPQRHVRLHSEQLRIVRVWCCKKHDVSVANTNNLLYWELVCSKLKVARVSELTFCGTTTLHISMILSTLYISSHKFTFNFPIDLIPMEIVFLTLYSWSAFYYPTWDSNNSQELVPLHDMFA